jgi:hypothetical protein
MEGVHKNVITARGFFFFLFFLSSFTNVSSRDIITVLRVLLLKGSALKVSPR